MGTRFLLVVPGRDGGVMSGYEFTPNQVAEIEKALERINRNSFDVRPIDDRLLICLHRCPSLGKKFTCLGASTWELCGCVDVKKKSSGVEVPIHYLT